MATKKRSHIHQYQRIYPNATGVSPIDKTRGVWACVLPDCTHYMPHNVAAQVVGKLSRCHNCMSPFQLTNENMKIDKPICTTCANPDLVVLEDSDLEYMEARISIANKTGRKPEDVTDTEVERMIQFRRLGQM